MGTWGLEGLKEKIRIFMRLNGKPPITLEQHRELAQEPKWRLALPLRTPLCLTHPPLTQRAFSALALTRSPTGEALPFSSPAPPRLRRQHSIGDGCGVDLIGPVHARPILTNADD